VIQYNTTDTNRCMHHSQEVGWRSRHFWKPDTTGRLCQRMQNERQRNATNVL